MMKQYFLNAMCGAFIAFTVGKCSVGNAKGLKPFNQPLAVDVREATPDVLPDLLREAEDKGCKAEFQAMDKVMIKGSRSVFFQVNKALRAYENCIRKFSAMDNE